MYHRDSNFADRLRFRFSGRANTPGACRRRGQLGSAIHTHIRPVSTRRQKPHFRQNTTSQGYCSINCGDDPFRSRRERAELVAISVQSNAAFESLRRPRRRRCGGADPKPTRRQPRPPRRQAKLTCRRVLTVLVRGIRALPPPACCLSGSAAPGVRLGKIKQAQTVARRPACCHFGDTSYDRKLLTC
jgi:hypothetical protein